MGRRKSSLAIRARARIIRVAQAWVDPEDREFRDVPPLRCPHIIILGTLEVDTKR